MYNVKKKPTTFGYGEVLKGKSKAQSWGKPAEIKKKDFHQHEMQVGDKSKSSQ